MTLADQATWPAGGGDYLLLLTVERESAVTIGRLGRFALPPGHYVYSGSARGPGGLATRLARHFRPTKRLRWHIDYLLPAAIVVSAYTAPGTIRRECAWVRRLLALPGASAPIPGFGSSDCAAGCPAHLIRVPADFTLAAWGATDGD
jgi:Uri superfamily endonuclease